MNKMFFLLFLLLIFAPCSLIYGLEIKPPSIDLGIIKDCTEVLEYKFLIRNNEKQNIYLENIDSTCKSITIQNSTEVFLESGDIHEVIFRIDLNLVSKGTFSKKIILYFKDSKKKTYNFEITGNISLEEKEIEIKK
ncbi:MAG: DUF1573 domain-containing protein [Candidatus Aureabacteria bacterium]|nr:DUF1573 domain-containing protein [Candidatus Auribacterota bacterium]